MRVLLLCLALVSVLPAIEVATGSMLGLRYDQRAFYIRTPENQTWRKTYTGKGYRSEARGKLMNLRLAQALFQDEWLTERPFDAARNTAQVIEALDFYKRHGVLMINVSLQGGNPGYEKEVNGIERQNGAKYGPGQGLLVSAFRPDGSLKPEWLARLESLLKAADQRGMLVCLMYFYQGQDEIFEGAEAVEAGARNVTDWLIDHKFRNVILDVANEWDIQGDRWDQAEYIPQNIGGLVERIRERFQAKRADFTLPIGASTGGQMLYPASLAEICDVVLLHGNGRDPGEKTTRAQQYTKMYHRPVLMNEDDNGRETTRANFAKEKASADALFKYGAGWGYMPWVQAQRFPFYYQPGPSGEFTDATPVAERDRAYFHAVLDSIARLVLEKPPEGKKWPR
ncbi:MAG: hypothetical protein HY238_22270 [Acidobacteria bacterium]|nr:hypothetical protein [Acidobacteriota bacterium]